MNTHLNARLTFALRLELVQRLPQSGVTEGQLATEYRISRQTVRKWRQRYATEGEAGLRDRSSRPRRSPRALSRTLRRQIRHRRTKHRHSSLRIAQELGLPVSTVVDVQRQLGLARLPSTVPAGPVHRYERARPGELIHLDVKKLGRIAGVGHRIHGNRARRTRGIGWEYLHVAIDDATRKLYSEVLADERGGTTAGFLTRALAWFERQGMTVEELLTDNGGNYRSDAIAAVVAAQGLKHRFTRPYRPQTNGKAERVIRTLLTEWAYAQSYRYSAFRTGALKKYLHFYNTERRHSALGYQTPAQRLRERLVNNVSVNNN